MKKPMRIVAASVCALALAGSFAMFGCSSSTETAEEPKAQEQAAEPAEQVELQIFAANSLEKALNEVQALYTEQTGVTFADTQYEASGTLNEMLGGGATADIEITASKGTMDTAVKEGYVDEGTRFDMFTNDLVIVAGTDSDIEEMTLEEAASGKYTDKSVEALNKAVEAAEGVLKVGEVGEVTQAAVQEASASLNKAVKALEEKPAAETVKKESLEASIEQAKKADKSKYTEEAWQALQSQIAAAQKVYDDKDAKQADVDAAQDALDKAFWATKVEQKPGSQQPGVTDTDKDDKDNKGDRVPPTGAAVSVVAAAAVLLTAAGVTILKRRQSGDHGSARHSA